MSDLQADQAARRTALNPAGSFIVQAPAGSGKTELLVQRLLTLLAYVDHPSEVLAITFTRKAAGEMRERLLAAIAEASDETRPAPTLSPALDRWQLARAVVARDAALGWKLLQRPGQLCIETFDAFARRLTLLAPLGSAVAQVGLANLDEDAHTRYLEAARHALRDEDIAPAATVLLQAADNRFDALIALVAGLLAKRAQWMMHLMDDSPEALAELREMLEAEIEQHIRRLHERWNAHLNTTLQPLLRYAADNLIDNEAKADALRALADQWPTAALSDLPHWCSLQGFLQTKEGGWRSRFTKNEGFPAKSSTKDKQEASLREAKGLEIKAVMTELEGDSDALRAQLSAVTLLPDLQALAEHETILQATLVVLKNAAAQLMLLESQTASTDFSGIALSANTALLLHRDEVLARLDARVRHILVDEFQDTNPAQAELIGSLIAEWSDGDGHTLFVVGDPMQSIYSFRDSDVGIFLDFWHNGVRNLRLKPLTLTANYRSRPEVIDWVNASLAPAFAATGGLAQRAVPFAEALPVRESGGDDAYVQTSQFDSAEEEADAVVADIRAQLERVPQQRIAVIVRTKRDGLAILERLLAADIAFAAQEFSAWAARPLLRDLLSLTYLLAQPDDDLSWFSWLRSPLVGLRLDSLDALAQVIQQRGHASVQYALYDTEWQTALPSEEQERLQLATTVLRELQRPRALLPLAAQVHHVWLRCGGERLLRSDDERAEVAAYFELLDAQASGGLLPPRTEFDQLIAARMQSFSTVSRSNPQWRTVDVLTIHKSKGLEWDTVYLPGLDRRGRNDARDLLTWQFLRDNRHGTRLLVAARETRQQQEGTVFDYVQKRRSAERAEEQKRLLYVAVTRARERLRLSGIDTAAGKSPAPSSLAALLPWPLRPAPEAEAAEASEAAPIAPQRLQMAATLTRLPLPDWFMAKDQQSAEPNAVNGSASARLVETGLSTEVESFSAQNARAIGIVGHKLLEGLGRRWARDRGVTFRPSISLVREALLTEGATAAVADAQSTQLLQDLADLIARNSEHLQFIFDTTHQSAQSELPLFTRMSDAAPQSLRLDRSFVTAQGERWVVDYKFSRPLVNEDETAWLQRQITAYTPQLKGYAQALRTMEPGRTVRCALYFPWLDHWQVVDV